MTRSRAPFWLACTAALVLQACAAQREPELSFGAGEWLSQVQAAHARADVALSRGDRPAACASLQSALDQAVPNEIAADHLRAVRQDLWFRLSRIALDDDASQALLQAERGLALGRHDDLFSANLLVARGRALEALGRDTEAASSYHDALALDERLLQAALR